MTELQGQFQERVVSPAPTRTIPICPDKDGFRAGSALDLSPSLRIADDPNHLLRENSVEKGKI